MNTSSTTCSWTTMRNISWTAGNPIFSPKLYCSCAARKLPQAQTHLQMGQSSVQARYGNKCSVTNKNICIASAPSNLHLIATTCPKLIVLQLGTKLRTIIIILVIIGRKKSCHWVCNTLGHLASLRRSAIHSSIILAVLFRRDCCVLLYCRPQNKTFCAEIGLSAWVVGVSWPDSALPVHTNFSLTWDSLHLTTLYARFVSVVSVYCCFCWTVNASVGLFPFGDGIPQFRCGYSVC